MGKTRHEHAAARTFAEAATRDEGASAGKPTTIEESGASNGNDSVEGGGPRPVALDREMHARADALILIGGTFSGERPHEAVGKAVDGLNRLASSASSTATKAG